jgi:hypothetical protein
MKLQEGRKERTGPRRENGRDGGADGEDDAVALEHFLRPSDEQARQRIDRNHDRCGAIREGARSSVVTLVEKKVSRTAAQELDARLRMLGSVSSARPAPPSRRTTIAPDLGASRLFGGCFRFLLCLCGWGFACFRADAGGERPSRLNCLAPLLPPLLHSVEGARPTCAVRNERPAGDGRKVVSEPYTVLAY